MADNEEDMMDDVAVEDSDNARDLTSGIVIVTSVMLLLAIFVMLKAFAKFYAIGPLAGN